MQEATPDPVPEALTAFEMSFHNAMLNEAVKKAALKLAAATVKERKATKHDPYHYRSILRLIYSSPRS